MPASSAPASSATAGATPTMILAPMKALRVFVTADIGPEAIQRLVDSGFDTDVHPTIEAPTYEQLTAKVVSGIDGLVTTIRDRIDETLLAHGAAAGPEDRGSGSGGIRQHRRGRGHAPRDSDREHARRSLRCHRRVRVLHDGRCGPQALPVRRACPQRTLGGLASPPPLARRQRHRQDRGRDRPGSNRQGVRSQVRRFRHGCPVLLAEQGREVPGRGSAGHGSARRTRFRQARTDRVRPRSIRLWRRRISFLCTCLSSRPGPRPPFIS